MYICQECNNIFSEEDSETRFEDMGECFGSPSGYEYLVCPLCGSDDIEEAKPCESCDEYENVKSYEGECYCDDCVEDMKYKFGKLLNEKFTAKERKLLYWCIDVNTWINKD